MYKKKTLIILLVLLTGCSRNKTLTACTCYKDDSTINIEISAVGDDITGIDIITSFEIPNAVFLDDDKYNLLISQLDNSFYFENNTLIKKENIVLDETYSLQKTIEYLRKRRFNCA